MFTHDTTAISPATQTLRNINFLLRVMSPDIAQCDVAILEAIAATTSQIAQDLRLEEDRLMAQIDEWEAFMADRIVAESDAADHSLN